MPAVSFVADSTADLLPGYREAHGILTVPLKVVFGEESLVDGVDIDAAGFYARMRASSRNPTTSQPSPAEFEAAFREAGATGQSVVCTTMSSAMSGTHAAALAARAAVADLDITVVDTRTVSIGHNAIVRAAVERAEAGASGAEVVEVIADLVRRQRSLFTVASLEYLRRGGRIGGARALLGSVLSIKPVLQVIGGRIEAYDRVRTNQRALERIAEELVSAAARAGGRALATVGHAERPEDAARLAEMVAPHCVAQPFVLAIGPIVGCHAGPGTLGMSFHVAG